MNYRALFLAVAIGVFGLITGGCKPRTTSQKIEDKAEDAQHEVQQGMERAKENVDDASKR